MIIGDRLRLQEFRWPLRFENRSASRAPMRSAIEPILEIAKKALTKSGSKMCASIVTIQ
jgi:hypothetical protein